jgi:hypothetical protein
MKLRPKGRFIEGEEEVAAAVERRGSALAYMLVPDVAAEVADGWRDAMARQMIMRATTGGQILC